MRFYLFILLFFGPVISYSQPGWEQFKRIDQHVRDVKPTAPDQLALTLTSPYSSDLEKTRAIFSWITQHIAYKTNRYKRNANPLFIIEDTGALKPLDERVAISVLQAGEAVCDGYARLFKTLCDYAGLEAVLIHGYAIASGRNTGFRPNHSWNAVRINGNWQLLDVTWAAGFIDLNSNQYISRVDERYFLTLPEIFIRDHYPEEHRWTLLSEPPLHKEYKRSPFIFTAYYKNRIIDFYPEKGIIEVNLGDTLKFEIKTAYSGRSFFITPFYFNDAAETVKYQYTTQEERKNQHPEILSSSYIVDQLASPWLYVIYNGEQIMRYRIKILGDNGNVASIRNK